LSELRKAENERKIKEYGQSTILTIMKTRRIKKLLISYYLVTLIWSYWKNWLREELKLKLVMMALHPVGEIPETQEILVRQAQLEVTLMRINLLSLLVKCIIKF